MIDLSCISLTLPPHPESLIWNLHYNLPVHSLVWAFAILAINIAKATINI